MKLSIIEQMIKAIPLAKAVSYKKWSFLFMSALSSAGVIPVIKEIFKDVSRKEIFIPIFIACLSITIYFIFFFIDLATGLIASKHESENKKNWVLSSRLYSSFGKIGGVLLITFLLLMLIFSALVIGQNWLYSSVLFILIMTSFLASAFEFHSIGENLHRRTKNKPPIFLFFDKVIDAVENGIINKISKLFDHDTANKTEDIDENEL